MKLYTDYTGYMAKHGMLQQTLTKALKIWTCCGIAHVFDLLKPKRILEIGRFDGHSLGLFCFLAPEAEIISVDPAPRPHSNKIAEWFDNDVKLINKTSDQAFADGDIGGPFDFALIDGDHGYAGAKRDWINTQKVMAPHGVVCFDNIEMACGKVFHEITDFEKVEPFHVSFRGQPGDGGHYGLVFMGDRP